MNLKYSQLLLLILLIAGGACVPNRKFVLLQKDDLNVKGKKLPTDSTVRSYEYPGYDYKVQSQDLISVRFESLTEREFDFFYRDVQVNGQFMQTGGALLIGELVDNEGKVTFPVIGKISVAGLSIFEIQDKLQAIADEYLESPVVKVRLINFRITVLGEVNKEGVVPITNNRASMIEVLALAGGMNDMADKANVKLIRQINGKTEVQYLNFLDEDFVTSPYFYAHQNDVLIVPPLRQRPFRRYFGQNLALVVSTLSLLIVAINLSR